MPEMTSGAALIPCSAPSRALRERVRAAGAAEPSRRTVNPGRRDRHASNSRSSTGENLASSSEVLSGVCRI
jgi:hypothetical protein